MTDFKFERELKGTVFRIEARQVIGKCSHCDNVLKLPHSGMGQLDHVLRRVRTRDWQVNSRGTWLLCDKCTVKQKSINKRRHEVNGTKVETAVTQSAVTQTSNPVEPSKVNKKRFAQILVAVNANFDETASKYLNGKSDEIIAKEFDVSPKLVSDIREQYVGKLAREPDELDKLKSDYQTMTDLLLAEVSTLTQKIKTMDEEFTRRYDKLRAMVRAEGH